jgi:hypothetical protein
MPKADRLFEAFRDQKLVKKFLTGVLVVTGLGGATVVLSPMPRHTVVAVEQQPVGDAVAGVPEVAPAPEVAPSPPPVAVTKHSSAEEIVKALVSQGQAAGLSEEHIKTVIATAKIESSFRPAVSGGVQAYGGRGSAADEVIGLFQEKASFGTVAERQDPNMAIARFIARFTEAFEKYRISSDSVLAATLAQNPQLIKYRHGGVGTHYYNTVKAAMGAAADLYHQATATGPQPVA